VKYFWQLCFSFICLSSYGQFGQFGGNNSTNIELKSFKKGLGQSLYLNKQSVKPGDTFKVLLDLQLKEKWFVYWQTSGGISQAMGFKWELSENISFVSMEFPNPKYKFDSIIGSAAFYNPGNPKYVATFKVADTAKIGTAEVGMLLSWQSCLDGGQCIQPTSPTLYKKTISIANDNLIIDKNKELFTEAQQHFPKIANKDWSLHAFQTVAKIKGPYDDVAEDKPVLTVTITSPKAISAIDSLFYPTTNAAHAQTVHHSTEQINNNTIQRTYELTLEEGQNISKLEGILVLKDQNGHKSSIELSTVISPSPFTLSDKQSKELAYRDLSGKQSESSSDKGGILYHLLLAFLGGFILNLMPCVFPVLSIKVMGFVNQAKKGKGHGIMHALVFTLGVLISFWILAGVTLALKSANQGVTWGFQLQNPYIMLTLILVLFALALNLFGVFEIGITLTSAGQAVQGKSGMYGSFMSGVLATVIATPCMAPMLGAALTFSFTQPPVIAMLLFTAIGLGLSSPYLFLATFPRFLKFIPKPGAWMETFKQSMGFLMMLAVVWLLETLQALLEQEQLLFNILWAFTLLGTALWIYGKYSPMYVDKPKRIKGILASLFIAGAALWYGYGKLEEKPSVEWVKFDPAKLEKMISQNKPVFVDFTATWCATCQVNKQIAIYPNAALLKQKGVILMKGDNTKHNLLITQWLDRFDSAGVPLNLLYDGNNPKPIKFPETFTKGILQEQLDKLTDK
jgi:thiol:disulfide interchange protein